MILKKYLLKNYKSYSFSANSLLESVIALSIMATIIAISVNIITVLFNSENSILYYKTIQKIEELQWETVENKSFKTEKINFRSIEIKKTIEKYNDNNELKIIEYTFELNNKKHQSIFFISTNSD